MDDGGDVGEVDHGALATRLTDPDTELADFGEVIVRPAVARRASLVREYGFEGALNADIENGRSPSGSQAVRGDLG